MITQKMPDVEAAINEESWEWMSDNFPTLAEAIFNEVHARNANPEQIRYFVMKSTQREKLAARCFQAAQHVESEKKE